MTFASTAALQVRLPTLTLRSLTAVFTITRFLSESTARTLSFNNITLCLMLYLIAAVDSDAENDVNCSR